MNEIAAPDHAMQSTAQRRDWTVAVVAGLTLLAAALRLYRLGDYGLWRDEAEAVFTARAAFPGGIIHVLTEDVHAPLYFFLLHFWLKIAGQGEFGVRLFSALCGIAIVPLLYVAGRELYDRRVGLLAAGIGAVLPLHVATSRTTRMYSLLPLLGLLALFWLYRALQRGGRAYWLLYAAAALATAYTHYWGVLWVVGLSAAALFQLLWERRPLTQWRDWALASAAVALAFLPWLPILWRQMRIQDAVMGPWLPQQSRIANLLRLFNELTALNWPRGWPFLWMLFLALGVFAFRFYWQRRGSKRAIPTMEISYPLAAAHNLTVAALFLPVLLGTFVLASAHGLTPSYVMMAVMPALCLVCALGIRALRPWPLAALVILLLGFHWLRLDLAIYRGPISSLREVAQHVSREAGPSDIVVVAPDYLAPTFSYYFQGPQAQIAFPWLFRRVEGMDWVGWADRRARAAAAVPATLDYIAGIKTPGARIWLIAPLNAYPGDPFFDQIRALKAALDARYPCLATIEAYRGPVETADIVLYGSAP